MCCKLAAKYVGMQCLLYCGYDKTIYILRPAAAKAEMCSGLLGICMAFNRVVSGLTGSGEKSDGVSFRINAIVMLYRSGECRFESC